MVFSSQRPLVRLTANSKAADYSIATAKNLGTLAGDDLGKVRGVSVYVSSGTCYVNELETTTAGITASSTVYTKSYASGTVFYLPFSGNELNFISIQGGTASIIFLGT